MAGYSLPQMRLMGARRSPGMPGLGVDKIRMPKKIQKWILFLN
jgi:hypothetical protein